MEFNAAKSARRIKKRNTVKLGGLANEYPHDLQFYSIPPIGNLSLQDFEEFAVERLKVLKAMENVGYKHVKGGAEYKEALQKDFLALRKQNILKVLTRKRGDHTKDDNIYEERRKDHVSHFILRLAYCRSEDLRRWFIQQEVDLFRYRFGLESRESLQEFLQLNDLDYTPIPDDEKENITDQLRNSSKNMTSQQVATTDYYKVPFTEALDLVKSRRAYLRDGEAYVPSSELVVIILSVFRTRLSHALAVTSRALPQLEEDQRLLPMLSSLSKRYLGQDYTNKKSNTGKITADMIDGLSAKSFPPCMQHLQQSLKREHHLKHWGRMQYGLFLKGIGMTLEESLKFWRSEFCKILDVDKFDKQYSYGIRHNFGKEGKRVDYTPYSCVKIITTNPPAAGDFHGCPFRHMDLDVLKQRLQSQSIPKEDIEKIAEHVKKGTYGFACGQFHSSKHHRSDAELNIMHPNQYFDESINGSDKKEIKMAGTPTSQRSSQKVGLRPVTSQSTPTHTQSVNKTDDFDDDMDSILLQSYEES